MGLPSNVKFHFAIEVVRADPPREVEAWMEGRLLGIAGRMTINSVAKLAEEKGTR